MVHETDIKVSLDAKIFKKKKNFCLLMVGMLWVDDVQGRQLS